MDSYDKLKDILLGSPASSINDERVMYPGLSHTSDGRQGNSNDEDVHFLWTSKKIPRNGCNWLIHLSERCYLWTFRRKMAYYPSIVFGFEGHGGFIGLADPHFTAHSLICQLCHEYHISHCVEPYYGVGLWKVLSAYMNAKCYTLNTTQTLSNCGLKGGMLYLVTKLCTVGYKFRVQIIWFV